MLVWPSSVPPMPWLSTISPLNLSSGGAWMAARTVKGPIGILRAGACVG